MSRDPLGNLDSSAQLDGKLSQEPIPPTRSSADFLQARRGRERAVVGGSLQCLSEKFASLRLDCKRDTCLRPIGLDY